MKFTQRLAYYLFGLLIGAMFLVFFFGQKKTSFCWVNIEDIRNCLTNGKVVFSESGEKVEKGKLYVIKGKNVNNEPITVQMVNYDERVLLYDVKKDQE